MVLPTVLKRRHSLKGVNLVPLLKTLRGLNPDDVPKDFARFSAEEPLESLPLEVIEENFLDISDTWWTFWSS